MSIGKMINGYSAPVVRPTYVDNRVLAADTPETITVPAGYKYGLLSFNGDVWVRVGGTANVPTDEVTDGTGSMLNPVLVEAGPGSTFSMEAAGDVLGSITWFK